MKYELTVKESACCSYTIKADSIDELVKKLKAQEEEQKDIEKAVEKRNSYTRHLSPQERTRNAVYATGNRWAIENFKLTH